jgi:hypothetical protein
MSYLARHDLSGAGHVNLLAHGRMAGSNGLGLWKAAVYETYVLKNSTTTPSVSLVSRETREPKP